MFRFCFPYRTPRWRHFFLPLSPSKHSIKCKGLWKCPRSSISAIFSNFQSAFPGIILFNLSNNGGHREHTNLRPHLQMRKLKLKEAEMLSQGCCTSPRCRTGTCRQELVGRGHPHPPYENGLPGRALCRKKPTAPSSLCNWKRVLD